eukprot:CAMPEP_0181506832 /NCGR_PEP_ID=MMETSP1110-20121109/58805_1 /TAXON_ID=174948 /ORGANISM="Symbiodinium sp., Strain CCMP421" /LENGTH=72 /DNA_ID=CAMNT_0023635917 /DNA_START=38 /DNA_END=252 /DNA_ORIENTATION=-
MAVSADEAGTAGRQDPEDQQDHADLDLCSWGEAEIESSMRQLGRPDVGIVPGPHRDLQDVGRAGLFAKAMAG